MKIFHFSDTHGFHKDLVIPDCDVIVFSGDESNYREAIYNEKEFYDFLTWYGAIDHPYKILIAGNHSTYICQYERIVRKVCKEVGIHYLNKNSVIIEDIKFYGDPLTPTFGDWSFMCKRETINRHWDLIPEDIDVLITHGPPKGILDLSYNRNHELEFCGDGALGKRIKQIPSIKAALFGHIHCLTPDYEVLTDSGWKSYEKLSLEDKVFNYNQNKDSLEYDSIQEIIVSNYLGEMYKIRNSNFFIDATPGHRVMHFNKNGELTYSTIESLYNQIKSYKGIKIPVSFNYVEKDNGTGDLNLRLAVWVAADGSREGNRWRFHLKKERKILRLKNLLEALNIEFNVGVRSKTGSLKISFEDKNFGYKKPLSIDVRYLSKRQCQIIVDEYLHTDGNFTTSAMYPKALGQISTSKESEVDLLMEVIFKAGYKAIGYIRSNKEKYHCCINIATEKVKHVSIRKNHITKYSYNGIVWCLKTKNSNFLIRKGGKIMLTGNSCEGINNSGVLLRDGITYSNGTCVRDGRFDLGIVNQGNLIEI